MEFNQQTKSTLKQVKFTNISTYKSGTTTFEVSSFFHENGEMLQNKLSRLLLKDIQKKASDME